MSGGYFNYHQSQIWDIAQEIKELIDNNHDQTLDEYGYQIGKEYGPKTIEQFIKAYDLLVQAYIYTQRIDWLVSDDDGEDSFHERLKEDLKEIKNEPQ